MSRDIALHDNYLKVAFSSKKGTLHSEEGAVEFYQDELGHLTMIVFKDPNTFKTDIKLNFKETYDKEVDAYYFYIFPPVDLKVGHTRIYDFNVVIDYNKDGSVFGIEILDGSKMLAN